MVQSRADRGNGFRVYGSGCTGGAVLCVCSGTTLFPGAAIVIFLLPIVGFDGPEHPLASWRLMIAFDTLIYSALFGLLFKLLRWYEYR